MDRIFEVLLKIVWILSILLVLYSGYYIFFSLLGFTKMRKPKTSSEPRSRILVIIAARNEALVIGNLIDSLMKQNYPRELFDVLVIPNNCTDRTAEVSRQHGAHVLECTVPVRSKGEALSFLFQNLPSELVSDAYCVFDADNVVHCDFLHHMDQARCAGAKVATGYRDSKNPYDTIFSACASIFYWMGCRLDCFARS
jgi:cellulose synthase/poly-beta-1,6-N-acetylglucosamine synthase-like glycosyltransferase